MTNKGFAYDYNKEFDLPFEACALTPDIELDAELYIWMLCSDNRMRVISIDLEHFLISTFPWNEYFISQIIYSKIR